VNVDRNVSGAFLIPYAIAMLLCGYPLMLIEFALGQYAAQGVVSIWKVCPLFEGKHCLCVESLSIVGR
jgi:solute carrier family 6 amino acid transporter-like protein 5/7/9/14